LAVHLHVPDAQLIWLEGVENHRRVQVGYSAWYLLTALCPQFRPAHLELAQHGRRRAKGNAVPSAMHWLLILRIAEAAQIDMALVGELPDQPPHPANDLRGLAG